MDATEKKLIIESQKGDMESFEALIGAYQKGAYNIAYRMLGDVEDAKDASQEAIIKIYRSIGGFRMQSSFKTWFFRVVTNTCLDYRRKRSRHKVLYIDNPHESDEGSFRRQMEDPSEGPEETLLRSEQSRALQSMIMEMPEKYRTALVLRDIRGFSYAEIGEMLDLPDGTVKSRISRARLVLKNIFDSRMEQKEEKSV